MLFGSSHTHKKKENKVGPPLAKMFGSAHVEDTTTTTTTSNNNNNDNDNNDKLVALILMILIKICSTEQEISTAHEN